MFIQLGGDCCVLSKHIVGVFDLDKITVKKAAREYINRAEKEGSLIYADIYELPKSLIVTKDISYLSPLNTATVLKRIKNRKAKE